MVCEDDTLGDSWRTRRERVDDLGFMGLGHSSIHPFEI